MAISGAQVPKETIVKAINILGTFNFKARELAASTKISEALIIRIKPAIKKEYPCSTSYLSILLLV